MALKLQSLLAASRKNNLARFGVFRPSDDLSWIDNAAEGPKALTPVTFSAAPVFDVSTADGFTLTLTGNVTSSTLNYQSSTVPSGLAGIRIVLRILQDGAGGRTFQLPTNLLTDPGYAIDPGPNRATLLPLQWNGLKWEFFIPPFSFPVY